MLLALCGHDRVGVERIGMSGQLWVPSNTQNTRIYSQIPSAVGTKSCSVLGQELLHPSIASFLCDYEHGVSPLPLCWICKNKYMDWIISEMTSSSNIWEFSPWWIGRAKFTTCNLPFLTMQRAIQQWIERKTQHMTSGRMQGVNQPWKLATRKPDCGSNWREMWLFIFTWDCT